MGREGKLTGKVNKNMVMVQDKVLNKVSKGIHFNDDIIALQYGKRPSALNQAVAPSCLEIRLFPCN